MTRFIETDLSMLDELSTDTPRYRPWGTNVNKLNLTPEQRRARARNRARHRYQNDPEYRERKRAREQARYYAKKEARS